MNNIKINNSEEKDNIQVKSQFNTNTNCIKEDNISSKQDKKLNNPFIEINSINNKNFFSKFAENLNSKIFTKSNFCNGLNPKFESLIGNKRKYSGCISEGEKNKTNNPSNLSVSTIDYFHKKLNRIHNPEEENKKSCEHPKNACEKNNLKNKNKFFNGEFKITDFFKEKKKNLSYINKIADFSNNNIHTYYSEKDQNFQDSADNEFDSKKNEKFILTKSNNFNYIIQDLKNMNNLSDNSKESPDKEADPSKSSSINKLDSKGGKNLTDIKNKKNEIEFYFSKHSKDGDFINCLLSNKINFKEVEDIKNKHIENIQNLNEDIKNKKNTNFPKEILFKNFINRERINLFNFENSSNFIEKNFKFEDIFNKKNDQNFSFSENSENLQNFKIKKQNFTNSIHENNNINQVIGKDQGNTYISTDKSIPEINSEINNLSFDKENEKKSKRYIKSQNIKKLKQRKTIKLITESNLKEKIPTKPKKNTLKKPTKKKINFLPCKKKPSKKISKISSSPSSTPSSGRNSLKSNQQLKKNITRNIHSIPTLHINKTNLFYSSNNLNNLNSHKPLTEFNNKLSNNNKTENQKNENLNFQIFNSQHKNISEKNCLKNINFIKNLNFNNYNTQNSNLNLNNLNNPMLNSSTSKSKYLFK